MCVCVFGGAVWGHGQAWAGREQAQRGEWACCLSGATVSDLEAEQRLWSLRHRDRPQCFLLFRAEEEIPDGGSAREILQPFLSQLQEPCPAWALPWLSPRSHSQHSRRSALCTGLGRAHSPRQPTSLAYRATTIPTWFRNLVNSGRIKGPFQEPLTSLTLHLGKLRLSEVQ